MNPFARRATGMVLAAAVAVGGATATLPKAEAAPTKPQVIVPEPCPQSKPFPAEKPMAEIRDDFGATYGFTTVGPHWTDPTYKGLVRVIWQTTDAIACTPFLADLRKNYGGTLPINAASLSGWKSGDFGITRANTVSLDFPQLQTYYAKGDEGHVGRLFVHELTHAYHANRGENPGYWRDFLKQYGKLGRLGSYGYSSDETMAETVAWYVARCAANNPYTTRYQGYYDYVKGLFGGKEFGAPLGQSLDCSKQLTETASGCGCPNCCSVQGLEAKTPTAQAADPAPADMVRAEPFDPVVAAAEARAEPLP